MYDFIAIEGNIGAGKTTLSQMISERSGAKLIQEQFADNPFLPKFYEDPAKHAFPLELFFLAERYHQLKAHFSSPDLFQQKVVSDYFIGKSLIFSRNNLSEDELKLFRNLYDIMFSNLPKPDLLIYLHLKTEGLQKNIKKRGRIYEQDIQDGYLDAVQKGYLDFLRQQKALRSVIVSMEGHDFVEDNTCFDRIFSLVERKFPLGVSYVDLSEDICA
jgi:deoxyadenosine/deoxycytidine kinase